MIASVITMLIFPTFYVVTAIFSYKYLTQTSGFVRVDKKECLITALFWPQVFLTNNVLEFMRKVL